MAEKFIAKHSVAEEINKRVPKSNQMSALVNGIALNENSRVTYRQIRVDEITPRLINKYRQSRIEELAQSIRNTNNRLIHPIVLVKAADLPEDHEVRKQIEAQGRDVNDYKYIIVSGERRYHAWMLLREEEKARLAGKLGAVNMFDTITANVLTKEEARNENAFYEDANNLARHLSPAEGVWFIKDALKEVSTDEEKRAALVKLNGDSEEGIDEDPVLAARKFRVDTYCKWLLNRELGVTDWSDSTIRSMGTVAMNCCDKAADALLAGSYPLREALKITSLDTDTQSDLIDLFAEDRDAYQKRLDEAKGGSEKKQKKLSHTLTKHQLKSTIKRIKSERDELMELADRFGRGRNFNELDAVDAYDEFIEKLEEILQTIRR